MNHLLDSDVVIDYLTGQTAMIALIDSLRPAGCALSVITRAEIMDGIVGSRDPSTARRGFRTFSRGITMLPVTVAIADRTGAIRAGLRTQKKPVRERVLDILIAATAIQHQLVLVTRNRKHYADIPGLTLYP